MEHDGEGDRFFALARDLLAVLDRHDRLVRVNPAWPASLGRPAEELVGMRLLDLVERGDRARTRRVLAAIREGRAGAPVAVRLMHTDGDPVWLELSGAAGTDGADLFLAARDVSASRRTESALRAAADRYRHLFDVLPLPTLVWELGSRRILAANDAAVRQYGYRREELLRRSLDDLEAGDGQHRRKNGSVFEVELSGHELDLDGRAARLLIAADLTERRRLEEEQHEAQRMEAIGRLAGGIAHDFNNLLTAINGYSQLMLASLEPGDPRREDAEQIRLAGERAASLTSQLLAFSRRQVLHPEVLDLNDVVQDLAPMLRRLLGAHVELRLDLAALDGRVLADRSRMEQVVVNLCVNARDAMERGGTLTIATADLALRGERRFGEAIAAAGRYVELRVRDTGVGMDEATMQRVFEPFFTTKERGRGTGLGLATAHGTVRQSGGHIDLASQPGEGSTFRILLPRAEDVVRDEPLPEVHPGAGAARGTILLVEDEPAVRSLAERVLRDAGYTVLAAADGGEAGRLAEMHREALSALVTDLVMPGENGLEVAERVRRSRPDLPVLVMSGHADDALLPQGALDAGASFLPKPFSAEGLLAQVRDLIAASDEGSG